MAHLDLHRSGSPALHLRPSAPVRGRAPRTALVALFAWALLLGVSAAGRAWFPPGHSRAAEAAVRALPPSMPRFFRDGAWSVGQAAVDPDLMKDRQLPALNAEEWPNHFIDDELLQGAALPADRWSYIALLAEKKLSGHDVGLLPYAVVEDVERLTESFAEHRRWPDDPAIQQRALVYAGILAHYAGDLEQPLHTTLHHDGRALPDGSSPKTGIHQVVDGLFERAPLDVPALVKNLPVRTFDDPWAAVQSELASSHALVDTIYTLEPQLRAAFPWPVPAATAPKPPPPSPDVKRFVDERFRSTASFIASLYWTAWQRSATLQIPSWLVRPGPGKWNTDRAD